MVKHDPIKLYHMFLLNHGGERLQKHRHTASLGKWSIVGSRRWLHSSAALINCNWLNTCHKIKSWILGRATTGLRPWVRPSHNIILKVSLVHIKTHTEISQFFQLNACFARKTCTGAPLFEILQYHFAFIKHLC